MREIWPFLYRERDSEEQWRELAEVIVFEKPNSRKTNNFSILPGLSYSTLRLKRHTGRHMDDRRRRRQEGPPRRVLQEANAKIVERHEFPEAVSPIQRVKFGRPLAPR